MLKIVSRRIMKWKKQMILLIISFSITASLFSQVDNEFWFAAPYVCAGHENTPIVFRISSYSQAADITINEPANSSLFTPISFHLAPFTTQTIDITTQINYAQNIPYDTVLDYGLKISSSANISAYYEVGHSKNPEIFPLKGSIGKGLTFLIPGQTDFANAQAASNNVYNPQPKNGFVIVATQNNTTVKIVASNAVIGHNAKDTFTVILNQGQTYAAVALNYTVGTHLGGSVVISDKPVFVTIYDDSIGPDYTSASGGNRDLVGDQILPEKNLGNEFIIVRGALVDHSNIELDYYYIWATKDNTKIYIDGSATASQTINRGQVYRATISNTSSYIRTDSVVYVYQITGLGGEMASTNLPSIKCTGSQLVSFVRSTSETFQLNLLCKTVDVGNFLINGNTSIPASLFQDVPGTNGLWLAARLTSFILPNIDQLFPALAASVVSNTSGLFHLGFLNGNSATGARLGYFSNYSTVQLSPVVTTATCFGSNIQLAATQYPNVSYLWSGPNNFSSTAYNPVIQNANMADSGMYKVTVNINGCGTSVDSVNVAVHTLPTISFIKSNDTLCYGSSKNINFVLSGTAPWNLIYTDGIKNDTLKTITQASASFIASPLITTVYSIKNITDSNTCTVDTTIVTPKDTLIVNALPVANFGYSTIHCEKNAVTFTDSSKANLDSVVHWYWIMGNDSIRNVSDKNPFTEIYPLWRNYTVKLAVQSSMGCKGDTITKLITIHPLPKVGFSLPEVCLSDASALFTDTTKMPDGSQLQSFKWNFDASTASPIVPLNKYPAPLTSAQQNPSIHYNFSSHYQVQEIVTSKDGCIDSLTSNFTVNGAKPHADYVVLDSNKLCSNKQVQLQNFSTVDFGNVTRTEVYWTSTVDSIDQNPDSGKVYQYLYPNFQMPATNTYTIKMIARSGNSSVCADSVTSILTLHQSPKVSFVAMRGICNDTTVRQITEATETTGFSNMPGTFTYYGSGVSPTGLLTPQSVAAGTYPIKYVFTTNTFGCSDSAVQNEIVWPSPVAKWGVSSPICETNNILFTDSSVANYSNLKNHYWNFGDATDTIISNNNPFTKKYTTVNNYTVSLRVMTDSGCRSAYSTQIINVHYLPKLNFGLPTICLPDGKGQFTDSTTIGDQSENLFTYLWNFGDPNDATLSLIKNPVHKYVTLGPYSVQLKVTSKDGCVDSLTQQLSTVYPQPKADFSIRSPEVCIADTIYFYDATTGFTGSIKTWKWDLAEGNIATSQNPSRQFVDSGTFKISLFIVDVKGCVSDTAIKTVVVDPYPQLSLLHNLLVLQGGIAQLKPVYYAADSSFNWSPSLYLDSSNIAYPTTKPLNDITYQLTITGKGNCSVSDTVHVKVLLAPVVPNAFSPNGDGINDTWVIQYLESYPDCEVKVFDRDGRIVFQTTGYNKPWDGTINGNALPIGTYYYFLNPRNGRAIISGSVTIIR